MHPQNVSPPNQKILDRTLSRLISIMHRICGQDALMQISQYLQILRLPARNVQYQDLD